MRSLTTKEILPTWWINLIGMENRVNYLLRFRDES